MQEVPTGLDGASAGVPVFVGANFGHDGQVTSLTFPLAVPAVDKRFLIVSVGLAGSSSVIPFVSSITYAGAPLALLDSIVGVPTQGATRTEQWQLVAPSTGTNDVVVTLQSPGLSIHASAMLFAGVNQVTPVRATAKSSGGGLMSQVTVLSTDGDLVESVVGHGGGIIGSGSGQRTVFLDNASANNSLDNAAGSVAPGTNMLATMSWTMQVDDNWQEIAASLQP